MNESGKKVAIIGGGISGLTTAFWLKNKGIEVKLFEKNDRVGGNIHTEIDKGFLVEHGPNSTLETTPLIDKLLSELGILEEKVVASEKSDKRYILRDGRIYPLPMKPFSFLRTRLFSTSAKLRLFKEPFIRSKGNEYETIAGFTRRRLGQEFLDYAINPFVAGVFAGDPNSLNVKTAFPKLYDLEQNHGSLIRGAIKSARQRKKSKEKSKQSAKTISFKKGMQSIVDSLYSYLKDDIYLSTSIEKIEPQNRNYQLKIIRKDLTSSEYFDSVIISTPSFSASKLISTYDKLLSEGLKNIYYPPVNVVFIGIEKSKIDYQLDGFGYLIPEKENRNILGSLWNSVLFPGRAPEGYYALTSFVGGARSPELTDLDDDKLIDTTVKELDSVLGMKSRPDFVKIIRWDRAIPQYNNHYSDIIEMIEKFMQKNKGLFVCCNYYKGISVCDCIKNADTTVSNVLEYLRN